MALVIIDVAFISLRHILPALPPFLDRPADIVALVKPQFEAGRDDVGRHGLVTDSTVHDAVLARVAEAAEAIGLPASAWSPHRSPAPPATRSFFSISPIEHVVVLGAGAIGSVYTANSARATT